MDSPIDPDHLSEFSAGFHPFLLPEDLIISSQPSPFLQDIKEDNEEMVNLSMVIEEHLMDKVNNFIHGRPDCMRYPYSKDPKLYCEKCFCCKCQKSDLDCALWDKYCYITEIDGIKKIEKKEGKD